MGGLAAFPRAVGLVVLAVLFGLHLVRAALVPFTLSHAKTDLEARSLYTHANRLQPRHEVELHYADDEAIDQSYLATVVARHETCQYLLVESFEEMLDDITCTVSQKSTESVRMSMKFGDQDFLDQAREAWQRLDCSILITHHVSCNQDFKERESYKCSSWTFNAGDATAVATCEPAPFGPDSDASTSLNLKGGVIQPETAQRLRARSWPGRKRITKRAVSTYTFTLDDSWAKKEYLIGLDPLFRVSCVDCHMRGAFAVGYNFDLRTPDWGDVLLSGDAEASVEAMKEAVQKMDVRLESVQPLDTAMNFQLEVNTAVKFSWPGLMARATTTEKPTLGKKILKKGAPVVLLKIGKVRVLGNYRYGVSVALELYAAWHANFPFTAQMPASQALYFDALNPSSSSNTLTPYVNFEPPTISAHQPEACVSVGIGPMVDLTLEVMAPKLGKKGTKFEVVTQIGVEVPKVETCFTDARNVDGQCRVGNIPQAVKEKTTVGLGLKFEVWFKAAKEGFIVLQSPVHKFDLDSLLDGLLHRTWDVSHHCFDIKKIGRALGFGSGGAPERSPVPPQQGPLPSPPPRTNPNGPVNGPITIPGSGPRVLNPPGVYRPLDPKQGSPSPIIPGTNPPLQPNYRAVPIQPGNSQPPPQVPPIRGTVRPPVRNTPTSPHEIPLDGTPYQVYHNDQSMSGARQNVPDPTRGRRVKKRPRFSIGAARLIS